MRGRSYSYSPPARDYGRRDRSPSPRGRCVDYGRRDRSPSPRGRYGGRGRDLPTSLLVRNLRRDCRPEDLRRPFGEFGRLKDVYLPRDYYTGEKSAREPRGFGFVQYVDPADADEAQYQMDGCILDGRKLTVVFAEENRKKPDEMRRRDRTRSLSYDRRRSSRYSRSPRRSRSWSSRGSRSLSRSPAYHSASSRHRRYLRSVSPRGRKSYRSPSVSRSRSRSPSPSPSDGYSRSRRSHRERSVSGSE